MKIVTPQAENLNRRAPSCSEHKLVLTGSKIELWLQPQICGYIFHVLKL